MYRLTIFAGRSYGALLDLLLFNSPSDLSIGITSFAEKRILLPLSYKKWAEGYMLKKDNSSPSPLSADAVVRPTLD